MRLSHDVHLTYCTNIHPSRGFDEVWASLKTHALPLKAALSPDAPFGIGLRLSGDESRELLTGDTLTKFRAWLEDNGLYVFTMNGFPHGAFHGERVKEQVHAPDWRGEERVAYTLRLIEILAAHHPEGLSGGISTSPLSYKAWVDETEAATWQTLTDNVVRVAEVLARLHSEKSLLIHLDIEPEPDGLLENSAELIAFFDSWLLPVGGARLAARLGVPEHEAQAALLRHIQVCFDTCHVALAFENPADVLAAFSARGIRVGKVQISSALELSPGDAAATRTALEPFNEPVYLHQVIAQAGHALTRFSDLPDALAALPRPQAERWRVHFHVPIFLERTGAFTTTQQTIRQTLVCQRQTPFTTYFEVETYTWSILPDDLKLGLTASIERELSWARGAF